MSPCVSDLALELFLLDELTIEADREHIIGCVRCRAQLAAKQRTGTAYTSSRGARDLAQLLRAADRAAMSTRMRARRVAVAAVAAVAAIAVLAIALPRDTGDVEAEVLAVERAWTAALVENDVAALDAILAADYQSVDAAGRVRTKADDLSRARSKTLRFDSYDTTNLRVRVWGNTAVVTGRSALRGSHAGKPFANVIAFTDTLSKIDGRWRAVSAHVTRVE